ACVHHVPGVILRIMNGATGIRIGGRAGADVAATLAVAIVTVIAAIPGIRVAFWLLPLPLLRLLPFPLFWSGPLPLPLLPPPLPFSRPLSLPLAFPLPRPLPLPCPLSWASAGEAARHSS